MTPKPPTQPQSGEHHARIVAEACEKLASGGSRFTITALHDHLNALAKDDPTDATLRALADGCAYCLVRHNGDTPGGFGPFAPLIALPDEASDVVRVYPRYLGDVDDDTLDIWAECADNMSLHPLVRARLADLLWVRRYQPARRWFHTAVDAYVQLADTDVESIEVGYGLQRAVAICAESRHRELRHKPLQALRHLIERSLASTKNLYGVYGPALRTLAECGHPFADLLTEALERYGSDPDCKSALLEIAIGASQDGDEIRRLRLEQIAAHEAAAEDCTGLLRVSRLDTARQIAARGRLPEHANRLTSKIERTDVTDDFHTIEIPIEIDKKEIRSQSARIVGDDGLLPALVRFALMVPTGDPEHSRQLVTEMAQQNPLMSLMSRFEFGADGGVVRRPASHEDRIEADLGARDARAIILFAVTSGECVLGTLRDRYGPDLQPMLEDCFGHAEAIGADLAEQIASSFKHWTNSDSAAAGSVIAGVIEPVARGVCRQLGINVTRTSGRVRALGELLQDLGPLLDPARARYLEAALVDERSLNLRNRAAHGLDREPPQYQFVVLFHIACLLMWVSYCTSSDT